LHDCSVIENSGIVTRAKAAINQDWRPMLPPTSDNKDDLNLLGVSQIKRVRQGRHVSFQSACLAIVSLELAIADAHRAIDIYGPNPHPILICPTLYFVDQYDLAFYETEIANNARNYAALCQATGQFRNTGHDPNENVFRDMAQSVTPIKMPKLVSEGLTNRFVGHWHPRFASYTLCRPRFGHHFWGKSALEIELFPPVDPDLA